MPIAEVFVGPGNITGIITEIYSYKNKSMHSIRVKHFHSYDININVMQRGATAYVPLAALVDRPLKKPTSKKRSKVATTDSTPTTRSTLPLRLVALLPPLYCTLPPSLHMCSEYLSPTSTCRKRKLVGVLQASRSAYHLS